MATGRLWGCRNDQLRDAGLDPEYGKVRCGMRKGRGLVEVAPFLFTLHPYRHWFSSPTPTSMSTKRTERVGVSSQTACALALELPGVTDGRSYGFPALKVGKKFLARLRDDNTVLVVSLGSFEDRDYLLADQPLVFFTTEHYRDYPTVLVRLAAVRESRLRELLKDAWRRIAPRRLVASLDERPARSPTE